MIKPLPRTVSRHGSLYDRDLGDFAGEVAYAAEVDVAGRTLALDARGLVARVRLGGRDLGEKGVGPFEWDVPSDLVGKRAPLEISLVTSIRPAFGRAPAVCDMRGRQIPVGRYGVEGIGLSQPLWCPTIWNGENGGLVSAEWR